MIQMSNDEHEKTPKKRKRLSNSSIEDENLTNSSKKIQLKCDKCNFTTCSQKKIEKHFALPECDSKELQCEYCDKKFKDLKTLEHHRNLHLGIKPYKCDHCDSFFGTKGEMNRHVKYKHTLEKPHRCTECEYSTVELSKLKRHMRVHTDERPYLCHLCDYASRDTFRLKRHLRTHTGEKPYECPICKNCFSQSNGLKSHIKTFHSEVPIVLGSTPEKPKMTSRRSKAKTDKNEIKNVLNEKKVELSSFIITDNQVKEDSNELFTCDQCFMRFLTKDLLIEHMVKHTGERPYACDICGMKFSHKFALRAHLLSHDAQYNEKLSQTLTNASQMTKNRFLHRKKKLSNEFIDELTSDTTCPDEIEVQVKETLSAIVESIESPLKVQLVTLCPVPNLNDFIASSD